VFLEVLTGQGNFELMGILLPEILPQEFLMGILRYMLLEHPGRRLTITFLFLIKYEDNI